MEGGHSSHGLGVELHHLLRLFGCLLLMNLLLLWGLIGLVEEHVSGVEEANKYDVEVLICFLLNQVVPKPSNSVTMLVVIHVRLQDLHENVQAILLWRQFAPLHRMHLRLPGKKDLADKHFMQELGGHNLGSVFRQKKVQAAAEVYLLGLVRQQGLDGDVSGALHLIVFVLFKLYIFNYELTY